MDQDFKGKTYVITGAGRGIGREVLERLHSYGATVYAIDMSPMDDLKTYSNVITLSLDLSSWSYARTHLTEAFKNVQIDGLVNNAGITICKPFEELTEDDYDKVMNINVKAVFNITQVLSSSIKNGGSIANLSSLAGLRAFPEHSLYHISKAGVDAMTRALALEFGARNIRVNSVNPTACMTEMGRFIWSDKTKAEGLWSRIPLYRFAELREVVDPILFFLGNQSSFINGVQLPIEGGFSAC
ncbi:L-xylulose reductase-like [Contarinia nasturtii]|uniref:L-xylulose reductase-like n=1 Tax=Contarinia nasturtii TaxID=265458 RepID=UPI0012D437BE|nr:L-xylulose reductase-like [Contarinia nasturtii]